MLMSRLQAKLINHGCGHIWACLHISKTLSSCERKNIQILNCIIIFIIMMESVNISMNDENS